MGSPYGLFAHYDGFGELNLTSGSTGTLPAGLNLGQERLEGGVKYRLFQNGSTAEGIATGECFVRRAGSAAGGVDPYFVTPTTTLGAAHNAAGCIPGGNTTVPTSYYFWGAVEGNVGGLLNSAASIATDAYIQVGVAGVTALSPARTGAIGYNAGNSNGTGTSLIVAGDYYVSFEELRFQLV